MKKEKGLIGKYHIQKINNGILEPVKKHSEYFILRLDNKQADMNHLKACRIAINSYADAIESHFPELAKDLKNKYPII